MVATISMRTVLLEQGERTRRSTKADIERLIDDSESKITSLESQINALVELRDRERACVAALRHLISPIHALPVELLAEMFELAIREYTHVDDVCRVAQVCSRWRQVAHSTPRLWTRPVEIKLRRCNGQAYVDALTAWLARSAPLTVPVTLVLGYNFINHIPDEILRTCPRWRSLRLEVPDSTPLSSFVSQLTDFGKFDNLEELDLGTGEEDDPVTFISFTTAPRLRKLTTTIFSSAISILVPWAQLTDLSLTSYFFNTTLNILAQCPSLVKAAIRTIGWHIFPETRQGITLSHLHALSLSFLPESNRDAMQLLDRMSTPALEDLCLDFDSMDVDVAWTQAHLTSFQLRAPNVTQLTLKSSPLTSDDLRTALRYAPSLTHLKIIDCFHCIDDALIVALHYKAGVSPLAPHLHNLLLHDIGDIYTGDILVGMIASRWCTDAELASRPVARWTRVQLSGDCRYFCA
ncbi:hypothetical protein MSAN_01056000 [Mycena sanguinolenta]|uniref:F-box domain-containing protein n=1 Tax=Mycena sanguinolenta TaxID=230812 RepID=A0A8H6YRR8_9AGAR|nr:hypothetical protein MSAN_01056000 [Mycena sanguinolenta]